MDTASPAASLLASGGGYSDALPTLAVLPALGGVNVDRLPSVDALLVVGGDVVDDRPDIDPSWAVGGDVVPGVGDGSCDSPMLGRLPIGATLPSIGGASAVSPIVDELPAVGGCGDLPSVGGCDKSPAVGGGGLPDVVVPFAIGQKLNTKHRGQRRLEHEAKGVPKLNTKHRAHQRRRREHEAKGVPELSTKHRAQQRRKREAKGVPEHGGGCGKFPAIGVCDLESGGLPDFVPPQQDVGGCDFNGKHRAQQKRKRGAKGVPEYRPERLADSNISWKELPYLRTGALADIPTVAGLHGADLLNELPDAEWLDVEQAKCLLAGAGVVSSRLRRLNKDGELSDVPVEGVSAF